MDERTTIQISTELRKELRKLAAERNKNYQELLEEMITLFQELDRDKTIISLPNKLVERVHERVKRTDFKTVSDYVTFLLRLLLYEQSALTEKDERSKETEVRRKLKSLGYI